MATSLPDAPFVLPSVVFRPVRLAVVCVVIAALAIGLAFMAGATSFGVFFSIGLALGLANALLVGLSVSAITSEDHPLKGKMVLNSATRLVVITAIALVIAFLFRPYGFGVLFGLAVFQVVLVLSTVLPVYKKLRKGDWDDSVPGDESESSGHASSVGPTDAE